MTTKESLASELLDRKRAEEIVAGYMYPQKSPKYLVTDILHDVGLGKNLIQPGKITTCVTLDSGHRIHIRRPDISTHDVLRGVIPYKDETVNLVNNTILEVIKHEVNVAHYDPGFFGLSLQSPVTVQSECIPIPYEHVLRQYIAESSTSTSLYFHYFNLGARQMSGHTFPDGLVPNQKLDAIYDTPSTKETQGDMSVSPEYLYKQGIIDRITYEKVLLPVSLIAWEKVQNFLSNKGLILVDTKLEFGRQKVGGTICLMDEVFTLDSSRFWRELNGEIVCDDEGKPIAFSKEYARTIAQGKDPFTVNQQKNIAVTYILAAQLITGKLFTPLQDTYEELVRRDLKTVLEKL